MSFETISAFATPFIASAAFVTLNEMGDKTQLLAMAFATRIKFFKVMLGVLIATLLNHGLAVAVGTLLASVPGWQGWVKFIAAVLFIIFGLWALKPDKLDDKETKRHGNGDVATVAIAFFFAEMGDKTQLATITLSAQYSHAPLLVLAGTTTGMLIADAVGIIVGVLMGRKLPDGLLKLIAAGVFVLFGLVGIWESLRETFKMQPFTVGAIVAAVAVFALILGYTLYKKEKTARTI